MINIDKSLSEILQQKYIVPLYQRSFAWGQNEITQLLQDIYSSFKRDKNSNYYIGSLVVLKRADSEFYEVIDGQQRLTAISLISRMLGSMKSKPQLTYDSRPDVSSFLEQYYNVDWTILKTGNEKELEDFYTEVDKIRENAFDKNQVRYFLEAIDIISNVQLDVERNIDCPTLRSLSESDQMNFATYFFNNVILVFADMPTDTVVASYFEVMNNRGEQLQKHEILKARFMDSILRKNRNDTDKASVFALIWDACSQMDVEVQKLFQTNKLREELFGENMNSLRLDLVYDVLSKSIESNKNNPKPASIDHIIADDKFIMSEKVTDEITIATESILDFTNFLMHIFRLMYHDQVENGISLDEKHLLTTYDAIESILDPMDFIYQLFYYRVIFDRYIIRSVINSDEEDNFRWSLRKPYKYIDRTGRASLRFKSSFGEGDEDNIEYVGNKQDRIIKCLSMLQVTYSSKAYKNWLQDVFIWFRDKQKPIDVSANDYIRALDSIALNNYNKLEYDYSSNLGTRTPHYLFNFIDYLYWVAKVSKVEGINISTLEYVPDTFDFKYRNSVEHHYPQSEEENVLDVDSLGNLCLISSSTNSSLNDKHPYFKAKGYYSSTLPPKRKVMYEITRHREKWQTQEIEEHRNEVIEVLKNRHKILGNLALDLSSNETIRALLSLEDISQYTGSVQGGEKYTVRPEEDKLYSSNAYKVIKKWQYENPLQSLSDFIAVQLKSNLELQTEENNWRKIFVKYPEILEYAKEGSFGWINEGRYILLIENNVASKYGCRELQSFLLYKYLEDSNCKLHFDRYACFIYLDDKFEVLKSEDDYSGNYFVLWLEKDTLNWCYQFYTDKHGNTFEVKALKNNGWVQGEEKFYYKSEQRYLLTGNCEDIERSVEGAIKQMDILLKEVRSIII